MNTEVSKRHAIYRLFSNGSENKYNIISTDTIYVYICNVRMINDKMWQILTVNLGEGYT